MAVTYSELKIVNIEDGTEVGTWGQITDANLTIALQEAIAGRAEANFPADQDLTLTLIDQTIPQSQVARNFVLNVTSAVSLTAERDLILPNINKPYIVQNNTTGSQSIRVIVGSTGVSVPNGRAAFLYNDSTGVTGAFDFLEELEIDGAFEVGGNATVGGTLDVTGNTTLTGTLGAGNTSITGTISSTGNATVGGTLGVTGNTTLSGTLSAGDTSVTGTISSTGNATVGGTLGVTGNTTLSGTLGAGNTSVTGTISSTGNATVGGTLGVTGNTTLSGTLGAGNTTITGTLDVSGDGEFSGTGHLLLPSGTTAQRPGAPTEGMLRYNSDLDSFEGYAASAWGAVGGGATGGGGDKIFIENEKTVTSSYTIPATKNAMTTGPVTIDSGVTVTVSAGSRWVVL